MPPRLPTVRLFAPELWGQVDFFSKLYSETYKFSEREQRALAGVAQHFEKALIFQRLANKLKPSLAVDQAELDQRGFTPATNSRELGTVIEATILELYSSIDCTAKVLRAIYGTTSRGFKESTRSLFKNFENIRGTFPNEIKEIIREVTWYVDLLHLRDELTHLGTGSCHLDEKTTSVRYMHVGLKTNGKPLIVDDVFTWLSNLIEAINRFLGLIFHFLRKTLKSTRVMLPCGFVEGRFLMRYVIPTEEITFASGECGSYQWFEQPDAPTCPFVEHCGAYARTRPMINPATVLAGKNKPPESEKNQ
jgi:hypothetical protein